MRYEITKHDGRTNTTRVIAIITDAGAAREIANKENARLRLGSSDHYSVRESEADRAAERLDNHNPECDACKHLDGCEEVRRMRHEYEVALKRLEIAMR